MNYWVYIMSNNWGSVFYIGVTNNIERRVYEHKNELIPGFTTQYHCKKLLYYESYHEITQAIAREKQLKKWSRAKKEALISEMNPHRADLAGDWY